VDALGQLVLAVSALTLMDGSTELFTDGMHSEAWALVNRHPFYRWVLSGGGCSAVEQCLDGAAMVDPFCTSFATVPC